LGSKRILMKIKSVDMKRNMESNSKRELQKEAGVFDGRFRQRVVIDKKKKESRNWARKTK
jgi:hypothetical protein